MIKKLTRIAWIIKSCLALVLCGLLWLSSFSLSMLSIKALNKYFRSLKQSQKCKCRRSSSFIFNAYDDNNTVFAFLILRIGIFSNLCIVYLQVSLQDSKPQLDHECFYIIRLKDRPVSKYRHANMIYNIYPSVSNKQSTIHKHNTSKHLLNNHAIQKTLKLLSIHIYTLLFSYT